MGLLGFDEGRRKLQRGLVSLRVRNILANWSFPLDLRRNLRRDDAFKEEKGIQGGRMHSRGEKAFKKGRGI